jgi:hypothetical protein
MITQARPTDDQIEIVRLRHELVELVDDVERLAQRFAVIDADTAAELAELRVELEASLRRLEALDHLADDDGRDDVIY